jgi:recombination protein RecA
MSTTPESDNTPGGTEPTPKREHVIPTGSLTLDRALGTGGWPRGRIVELYGSESAGKTTLLLEAIAQAQRNNGVAALIDADHGSTPDSVARLGVDPHGLVLHRANQLEEVFTTIATFINRNIDVIALDSIASLQLETDQRSTMRHYPPVKHEEHQRAVEHYLKSLLTQLARSRSVLLISNQQREKIGVMYGDPNMTPWETHPVKDFASQRVEVKRVTHIKQGDVVVGYEARVRVIKNRLAPAFTAAEFEVYFDTGISEESQLIPLGLEVDVLTKSGRYVRFGEVVLGRDGEDAIRRLRREPELAAEIRELIRTRLGPSVGVPPSATEPWVDAVVKQPVENRPGET